MLRDSFETSTPAIRNTVLADTFAATGLPDELAAGYEQWLDEHDRPYSDDEIDAMYAASVAAEYGHLPLDPDPAPAIPVPVTTPVAEKWLMGISYDTKGRFVADVKIPGVARRVKVGKFKTEADAWDACERKIADLKAKAKAS